MKILCSFRHATAPMETIERGMDHIRISRNASSIAGHTPETRFDMDGHALPSGLASSEVHCGETAAGLPSAQNDGPDDWEKDWDEAGPSRKSASSDGPPVSKRGEDPDGRAGRQNTGSPLAVGQAKGGKGRQGHLGSSRKAKSKGTSAAGSSTVRNRKYDKLLE